MPKITAIGKDQRIARHVKRAQMIADPKDRNLIIGCFPDAYRLRPARNGRPPEAYLSTAWIEHYASDELVAVSKISSDMEASGYKFKKGSGFAVGRIGKIEEACSSPDFKVLHNPKSKMPAHAEVWGVPQTQDQILVALGTECWAKVIGLKS